MAVDHSDGEAIEWLRGTFSEYLKSEYQVTLKLVEQSLAPLAADRFELDVYFGKTPASGYDVVAGQLFAFLQAPLFRASFERGEAGWITRGIRLASPPMRSISRVPAAWMTAPALRKSSDLKSAWFRTCSSAPPRPSATQLAWPSARPSSARPRPIAMMPMFSMLL